MIVVIAAAVSAVSGFATYYAVKARSGAILKEAENEGEMIKKEKMLQAKEKFIQLKSEYDKQVNERNQKLSQSEQRAKQIEAQLQNQQREAERKIADNDRLKEKMESQMQALEHKKEELAQLMSEQNSRLEQISGMSSEEAKNILIENMKAEAKSEAAAYINETVEEAKLTATKEAKRIIVASIQRVATETAIENSVTVFNIDSDEVKGRIIGREGRNIRALEAATGIEIIVDDTPEAIILSGFDPVRREIARLALHQLVTDGRIHPARIEEVVAKVKKQIEEEIVEVGKRTAIDLGIHGLHPELIRLIGKMKYRSSYGQNLLQHARETANLAGIMAAELGLNPKAARRAGLLHDIATRNHRYETRREVQGEAGDLQRHRCPPRRGGDDFAHRAHHSGVRCDFGCPSGCAPRGYRVVYQAIEGDGGHRAFVPGCGQDLRHSGGSRVARNRRCGQVVGRRERESVARDSKEDSGRNDVSRSSQNYCYSRDAQRKLREVAILRRDSHKYLKSTLNPSFVKEGLFNTMNKL